MLVVVLHSGKVTTLLYDWLCSPVTQSVCSVYAVSSVLKAFSAVVIIN